MRSPSINAWVDLLASLIPGAADVGLLQIMLWDGKTSRDGWSDWATAVGDPKAYFEREYVGRKGLLAFLGHRIGANSIDVGREFATYVRVAQLREELRSRIYIDLLGSVQSSMDSAGLEPVLINGAACGFTVYPNDLLRHNHGIDLLLPRRQIKDARKAISEAGFQAVRTTVLPQGSLETYEHDTGLELTLRSRLFLTPHIEADPVGYQRRCRHFAVEQMRVRVLAPTDLLCHTLGERASAPTHNNLRWACDAFLLLTHEDPIDFSMLAATADEMGIALPTGILLNFFREQLRAPVPTAVTESLLDSPPAGNDGSETRLLSTALRSSTSVDDFLRRAKGALFLRATRFALIPSTQHIAYQRPPTSLLMIPLLYVFRAARLLLRPFKPLWRLKGKLRRRTRSRRKQARAAMLEEELES